MKVLKKSLMIAIALLAMGSIDLIARRGGQATQPAAPTALASAIDAGDLQKLKELIADGANNPDSTGNTPLILAISKNKPEIATFLLQNGADPNIKNTAGEAPLIIAAKNKNLDLVKLLITNKANINTKNADNMTPLATAANAGNFDMVKFLVENKADINTQNINGLTPLMIAANIGNLEMATLLINDKSDVNNKDKNGMTAFNYALNKDSLPIVQLLMKNGASTGNQDLSLHTLLTLAISNNDLAMATPLITKDNVNARDKSGWTPLTLAAKNGNLEIVQLLLKNGADVNLPTTSGNTQLLYGPNINPATANVPRNTPLIYAIKKDNLDIVKLLLQNGAKESVNKRYQESWDGDSSQIVGQAPLILAINNGNLEMVKLLVQNGADINAKSNYYQRSPQGGAWQHGGDTPLELAQKLNKKEITDYRAFIFIVP